MSATAGIALIVLAGLAAWLAWRYAELRRAIRNYEKSLRELPFKPPGVFVQLEGLSLAVRAYADRAERQLATLTAERSRLSTVLDQLADGVLIADSQGKIQFANPAARRLFDAPEPLGRSVTEVLRHHQLVDAWQRSRLTGQLQSESVEIPIRHQYMQLIVVPDEHAGGSLLLVQDLTRVRRLETVRRDFVSNISHELRTPLASLKALTETLQGGALADPKDGPHFLARINAEVDALIQMAQELLDLSRIESGQVALDSQHLGARALLRSAATRMMLQADRAGVSLRVDGAEDGPELRADASRLEQVLINLIHNAVKFSRPGGEVVLSAEDLPAAENPEADVLFAVKDTGVGIPADDLPRIFERFYRVDRSRTRGGTGLGLSIARHLVEAHGGRIWADSIEGQGSTFYFSIPKG